MFERRLKILVAVMVAFTLVLIGRAFAVQVIGRDYWETQSSQLMTRVQRTETTRGGIRDCKGRLLAVDVPCTDACVDYRAIPETPDAKWVADVARKRVAARLGDDYKKLTKEKRQAAVDAEVFTVKADLTTMWATLSQLYQPTEPADVADPAAAVADIRTSVVQMVEARRRNLYDRKRAAADAKSSHGWVRWLGVGSKPAAKPGADPMAGVTVAEQEQSHVILHALDADACNFLGKRLDAMPGLSLRPSTRRSYPMKTVAPHVLGRESRVNAADIAAAKGLNLDDARQYRPNDLVGRDGAEALCEPILRGGRGKIETRTADGVTVSTTDFAPGQDATLSIDADLQRQVQEMLRHVVIYHGSELATPPGGEDMHAAVVVLDVKTNAVLALASNPGFDVNELQANYAKLAADELGAPLRNRATMDACEPGSTCKPMIGIGAITDRVIGPTEGIECTGFLVLPMIGPDGQKTGRLIRMPHGRCWVESERGEYLRSIGLSAAHHPIPTPHVGHDGNPDGFLTYSDALERSCNVFFETTADRLGPAGVDRWLSAFGIGHRTGIGIYEVAGMRPSVYRGPKPDDLRMTNCYAAIGEQEVQATPLQVANEAATFARDGVWMRPELLSPQTRAALDKARPRPADQPPDAVDLHLDSEGLRQAKIGMVQVVDDRNGTGNITHPAWLKVAGKTGTAEVSKLMFTATDADGTKHRELLPAMMTGADPTPTPWYKSDDVKDHTVVQNWYMGYAPAEHPTVAFAVLIEYAGSSGGHAAGPVASRLLDALVTDGYLVPPAGAAN